jgi:hypothetical protein
MPFFSRFLNQFSNQSCVGNCLPECLVTTEGQEGAMRPVSKPLLFVRFLLGLLAGVTARDSGADLLMSPRDGVSGLRESVSRVSVVGEGSKRARMRVSGLFITSAVFFLMALGAMGASAAYAASPWWHLSSGSRPAYLAPGGEGTE